MAGKIAERFAGVSGDQDRRTIRYLIQDCESDNEALNLAELSCPIEYDNMPRENISVTEIRKLAYKLDDPTGLATPYPVQDDSVADGSYYVEAVYTRSSSERASPAVGKEPDPNPPGGADQEFGDVNKDTYSFEVSLESEQVIFCPIGIAGHISVTPGLQPDGTTPFTPVNHEGLNWQGAERGYEGIELSQPKGSFTLNFFPQDGKVTKAKEESLQRAVGRVNSLPFYGYEKGEVRCTSVRGQGRTTADWQINATFAIAQNRTNLDLGNGCVIPSVQGWDYVDVEYYNVVKGTPPVLQRLVKQATLWQVFWYIDFNTIFTFA